MTEIQYDDEGRPLIKFCPLCGERQPGGIWGAEEVAATSCEGCGGNVMIDVGPEVIDT